MIKETLDADPASFGHYDDIIDVRSPGEFEEDHIPGAINLPVLDDDQRAEVGTIYVQQSRFLARRIGAAHVARNITHHLDNALSTRPSNYYPLIYCWRGGQRSHAMATVLSQVGWRTGILKGGYKTWRRSVVEELTNSDEPLKLLLLDGQTGSAKTEVLNHLSGIGVQILDLEAIAAHRGSVFGGWAEQSQPSQKMFESNLWLALSKLDVSRPIVVEAESNHIGRCMVPRRIWKAMRASPRVEIQAEPTERARYLLTAYADIVTNPTSIKDAVNRLTPFHSKNLVDGWHNMVQTENYIALAASLMRDHYDPLYDKSRKRHSQGPIAAFHLNHIDNDEMVRAAHEIRSTVEQAFDRS